ncbi:MAG TPA: hypothetical protein VEH04_14855 [Verrucomicrobiae bacterium]|nr:hypothetical protein [Verrucomicrobiae bacterium]
MNNEFRRNTSLLLNIFLGITVVSLVMQRRVSEPAIYSDDGGFAEFHTVMAHTEVEDEGTFEPVAERSLPDYAAIASPSERRRLIIDQLRAMGAPNELLGRVARVDFEMEWERQFAACSGDMEKLAAVQLDMNLSKDAEMRAALGEEGFRQWDRNYMLWEAMSTKVDVNQAEAGALYSSKKKLQQRLLELDKARLNGSMDDAQITEAIDTAYAEFHGTMKDVLGTERYAKSQQMDETFVKDSFRHQLAKANPTDAQFDALFKVETEWNKARMEIEEQFQGNTFSPEYGEKLRALDALRDAEFQTVLGEAAFDALRKSEDPAYVRMKKFQGAWGLDERDLDFIYDTMGDYHKGVESYQAEVLARQAKGENVDWDSVTRNLQASAEAAQRALQERLGQESFSKLQRNRVLRWASLASSPLQHGSPQAP